MVNRIKFDVSTTTILKIILAGILVWFFFAIREIVVLFFIVLVIVAAVGPLVDRLSRYLPRIISLIIVTVLFLAILTGIGFLIIPPVIEQIQQLALNLPLIASKYGPLYNTIQNNMTRYQDSLLNLSSQLGSVSGGIYSTTIGFVSGIVAIITILVMSFYMLLEQNSIKNFLHQTVPLEHKDKIFEVMNKIGFKMGGWLRSQFILMIIIGVADGIVLMVLGVPYALTLAVWGGLTEVIPYIGPWLGLIPALIVSFTLSPLKGLLVFIAYLIIQQLESQFLVPKIMGKAVGLSPVIIILAILVGAKLMGILGVLIAVPSAAAVSVIIQEWSELKKLWTQEQ